MAHAAFTQTVTIAAQPGDVRAALADFTYHDAIHPMIVRVVELAPETLADGTRLRCYAITDRMRLGPASFPFTYRATIAQAADTDNALISDAYQRPRVHLHNVTRCLPDERGGTRVEEQVAIEAPRLLIGLVRGQAYRAHVNMLANLKRLLESGALGGVRGKESAD